MSLEQPRAGRGFLSGSQQISRAEQGLSLPATVQDRQGNLRLNVMTATLPVSQLVEKQQAQEWVAVNRD